VHHLPWSRVVVLGGCLHGRRVVDGVEAEEVRSALEWAQVRAMAADGLSQREIARRLGINRRTVARLMEAEEQPRYERQRSGSMLDPLEGVLRELLRNGRRSRRRG
jgi:DNA invertase Pin-like site-specific DNA recombinase